MTHICVDKLTTTGSDNGLSPGQRQAIIWTNAGILFIRPSGINFNENLIEINTFSFKEISLQYVVGKVAAILSQPQCVNIMTGFKTIVHAVRQLQYGNLDHTLNFAGELLGGRCEDREDYSLSSQEHTRYVC